MSTNRVLSNTAVVCSACGGDPRASRTCSFCGGAGVGVASDEGFLVWISPIHDASILFRSLRRRLRLLFHFLLLVCVLASLGYFIFRLSGLERIDDLAASAFWLNGRPEVIALWFGALLGCFLLFHRKEYAEKEKQISRSKDSKPSSSTDVRSSYRFDVAPYYTREALDIVEDAYRIARDLKRMEIGPDVLFAAVLASRSGGICMLRLGMSFDAVKGPLARLLVAGGLGDPPVTLSKELKRTLALAYTEARAHSRAHVDAIELFLQSFKDSPKVQRLFDTLGFPPQHVIRVGEWIRLQEWMREEHHRFAMLAQLKPSTIMNRAMTAQQTPLLDALSQDLTHAARNGAFAPIVGREEEMTALLRGIESGRRSVVLVGDPGVGKTSLVEQLARRMVEEDIPPELFDRRLVAINVAQVVAAGEAGLAVDRLLGVLHEVGMSGNIILVIQGIEALVGSGSGPMDLAEAFASELDRGYFIAIATTTPHAWTQYLERRSLGAKLVKIPVLPLDVTATLRVLMAVSGAIEAQNHVFISYAALEKAASLAIRYLTDIAPPENAVNVLHEAAVHARTARGERATVGAEDVARVIHAKTNIPVEAVTESEAQKLLELEARLHERIVGQELAVTTVAQAMRRAAADIREGKRPIASLLFLGPTGVGKTELAKALAADYFGNEKSMIRLDMSEYQDVASVARMIGAPGDERGGLLTEAIRHHPFSIVLFDEIEKAHPDILNLFLQLMDDGRITDGIGRTIDCTNTIVIMTSNAGTPFIQAEVARGTPLDQIRTVLLERELKGLFRPEFLNRFDGIIVFQPLSLEDVTKISRLLLRSIEKRLEEKGIALKIEDGAFELLGRAGFDPLFGARPLRRAIQDRVDNALAELLLKKEAIRGDTVILLADGTLRVERGKLP